MIILKRNNTLSEQLIAVEKELSKGSREYTEEIRRTQSEVTSIQNRERNEHYDILQVKKELQKKLESIQINLKSDLQELDNNDTLHATIQTKVENLKSKEVEQQKYLKSEERKIVKDRKSAAINIGLGASTFGFLFLLNSLQFIYMPLVIFLITYLLIYKLYDTPEFRTTRMNLDETTRKRLEAESHIPMLRQNIKDDYQLESDQVKKDAELKIRILKHLIQQSIKAEIHSAKTHLKKAEKRWTDCHIQLRDYYDNLEKGNNGEKIVTTTLERSLSDKFYLLNDITIPSRNGRTTQIDHIVISPYGLIALETKHIEGTYYPQNKSQWRWCPVNNGFTDKKILCANPQEQSIYHAQQLKYFIPSVPVLPVVVLTNPVSSYKGSKDTHCPVVNPEQLVHLIKHYSADRLLSSDEITCITQKLLNADAYWSEKHSAPFGTILAY